MTPIHVSGAEGETVEFKCSYPDAYKYTPKYFCREPCGSSDVLITSGKSDGFVSKGRYSVLDTTSAKTFSVTIKTLQLQDAGVYYCGLDQWGRDTLTKVVLKVRRRTGRSCCCVLTAVCVMLMGAICTHFHCFLNYLLYSQNL